MEATQGVIRLKELLLDKEQRRLDELSQRVESLDDVAGTEQKLTDSVARVLDRAIRSADETDHARLATAVRPVIAHTVGTEIEAATPKIVEALHPHMGYMVAQYVSSAFKDMMAKINRQLESGLSAKRWGIKIRSALTGRPESELLLASLDVLRVDELFLIRRGSGDLVQHWEIVGSGTVGGEAIEGASARDRSNRDAVLSGYLTAINDFAKEAFAEEGSGLQTLDTQKYRIYLRTSPMFLLAAKCSGTPTPNVEQALDEEFRRSLEAHGPALAASDRAASAKVLPELGQRLQQRILEGSEEGGGRLAYWLLGLIAVGLVGWIAWDAIRDWQTEQVRRSVTAVIEASSLRGYPIRVEVERGGGKVRLKGLAPAGDERDKLVQNVALAVGAGRVDDALERLPTGLTGNELQELRRDMRGDLRQSVEDADQSAANRALERGRGRMARIVADLNRLDRAAGDQQTLVRLAPIEGQIVAASSDVDAVARLLSVGSGLSRDADVRSRLRNLDEALRRTVRALTELRGEKPESAPAAIAQVSKSIASEAEAVALSIENLASEVSASERFLLRRTIGRLQGSVTQFESTVGSLRSTVAALEERLRGISAGYAPTVRERLDLFARSHAIFFSDDTTFADEAAAAAVLDQVAEMIKATGTLVRIVGFTDETGQPQRNQVLATERASRVRAALVQRGVPAELLAVIGRADGVRISTQRGGSGSPNRRVEFEPAFVNEPRGG